MQFPLVLNFQMSINELPTARQITIHGPMTTIVGPNGSGKTHLMRAIKSELVDHCGGKKVRFISAGRVGMLEQYRSIADGYVRQTPEYESAQYGSKSDASRRHEYETLQGDFQVLAARPDILVKVRERLRKLFSRDIVISWDGGNLKILFSRIDGAAATYSSAREASGLLHLVGLLTAIYDDDVGALLIDEPEVSLHPQLQAFLFQEMLSVSGEPTPDSNKKLIVIGTHSTEFIRLDKPLDIPNIIFCQELETAPVQVPVDAGELLGDKLAGLIARMGQEHKLAFFSKSPLLIEGPSDSIICNSLARRFDLNIEAGGSQLLPVIGKGQFPIVVKLFRLAGKTPLVLADADGFADGMELSNVFLNSDDANRQASVAGFASAAEFGRSVYSAFSALVANYWQDIASHAEQHSYWLSRETTDPQGVDKAKRRSAFSTIFRLNDVELSSLGDGRRWVDMKARLQALLSLIEAQGCFFLRLGAIESYFISASSGGRKNDKPAAAVIEAGTLFALPKSQLIAHYEDVIRSLRMAAKVAPIVEAETLQDYLLAVAAAALARAKGGATSSQLAVLARSIIGESSSLFKIAAVDGGIKLEISSNVLEIPGFPLVINYDDDVVKVIFRALGVDKGQGKS